MIAIYQVFFLLTCLAFEKCVLSSKSFLIAINFTDGNINVEDAIKAANLEIEYQKSVWGDIDASIC